MQLGARILSAVSGVNSFEFTTQVEAYEGDAVDFYFQFVDKERLKAEHGFNPAGLRYIPTAPTTVTVEFINLDGSKQFTRTATAPFSGDTSIWKTALLSTDPLRGTVSVRIVLNENGARRTIMLNAALLFRAASGIC